MTPDGDMGKEKYRLVVEGPPNYTNFRQFWKMFYDEGAVVEDSTHNLADRSGHSRLLIESTDCRAVLVHVCEHGVS